MLLTCFVVQKTWKGVVSRTCIPRHCGHTYSHRTYRCSESSHARSKSTLLMYIFFLLFPKCTVKFTDVNTGLHVDINCNEQLGLLNTYLIKHYCDLYQPLRPLLFFLKTWAKSHGFNDPSGGGGPVSFSSYCLTLMTISWLQVSSISLLFRHCQYFQADPGPIDDNSITVIFCTRGNDSDQGSVAFGASWN